VPIDYTQLPEKPTQYDIERYISKEKERLKEEAYALGWGEYFSNRAAEYTYNH
jgi:hypothetical protein